MITQTQTKWTINSQEINQIQRSDSASIIPAAAQEVFHPRESLNLLPWCNQHRQQHQRQTKEWQGGWNLTQKQNTVIDQFKTQTECAKYLRATPEAISYHCSKGRACATFWWFDPLMLRSCAANELPIRLRANAMIECINSCAAETVAASPTRPNKRNAAAAAWRIHRHPHAFGNEGERGTESQLFVVSIN